MTTFYSGNVTREKLQEMLDFILENQIDVTPEKIFTLENIQKAHNYLESEHSFGKIVIVNKED